MGLLTFALVLGTVVLVVVMIAAVALSAVRRS